LGGLLRHAEHGFCRRTGGRRDRSRDGHLHPRWLESAGPMTPPWATASSHSWSVARLLSVGPGHPSNRPARHSHVASHRETPGIRGGSGRQRSSRQVATHMTSAPIRS
jgi:hypothetical protein